MVFLAFGFFLTMNGYAEFDGVYQLVADKPSHTPGLCVNDYLAGTTNITKVTLMTQGKKTIIEFPKEELKSPIVPIERTSNPFECDRYMCVLFNKGNSRKFNKSVLVYGVKYKTTLEKIEGTKDLKLTRSSKENILGFGEWENQSCILKRIEE